MIGRKGADRISPRMPVTIILSLLAGAQVMVLALAGEDKVPVPGFELQPGGNAIATAPTRQSAELKQPAALPAG
jgi:hypothetical protein